MSIDRELDTKDMAHIYNGMLLLFTPSVVPNSFANSWTISHQAPLSRGFPRQEYWSGLSSPFPGDLLDPEIKSMAAVASPPMSMADMTNCS